LSALAAGGSKGYLTRRIESLDIVRTIMGHDAKNLENEIEDLRHELDQFQKEKERVRKIVGSIGGVPKFRHRLVNALFVVAVAVPVVISIFAGEKWRLIMIEIATVTLSLKIIFLIHNQMKMDHFKFWILSSLEWRINEISREIRKPREN
jgi:hypothetical protein